MNRVNASLRFLLDTNIVSQLVRNPAGSVRDRIADAGEDSVCVDVLVAAELRFGAAKRQSARLVQSVEAILSVLPVLAIEAPWDEHYAEIRLLLETQGRMIGPNDLIIAAHARALDLTLITDNVAEFSRVPELRVENWLRNPD